jgi:nucleotide-binding universal stress UspA family protein
MEAAGAKEAQQTVIIAYDGSPAARHAVEQAAKVFGASRALVVTVWEEGLAYLAPMAPTEGMMMTPMVEPGVAMEVDRSVHHEADRVSQEGAALATSRGLDARPLAVPDQRDVARTILAVAEEHQAAAIVVGSRGLSGIRARLEGSTSKALLKHAACPVFVVHEDDDEAQ